MKNCMYKCVGEAWTYAERGASRSVWLAVCHVRLLYTTIYLQLSMKADKTSYTLTKGL